MTRVIVLNHYPVLPAQNGGQATVRAITRELALAWPTELVWIERKVARRELVQEADRHWQVTVVPNLWQQRHLARGLRHALGQVESDVGTMLCSGANRRLVEHLLSVSDDGDIFMLAHPWLWPALRHVLRQRRATFVYDAHNVEHVLKEQGLRPSAVSRWVVDRTRQLEAEVVRRADLALACTDIDAEALGQLAGVPRDRFLVGMRGVQPSASADEIVLARARRAPGRRALFVGSRHPPNDMAARWIIESLAPAMPDWHFDIAGACGPDCGVVPRTPNVRVLGHVDDVQPLMAGADIGLNPITTGSGVNMKLFEYLQHGLPVVSTPFGARGLRADASNGLVVVPLDAFAAALAVLASDPERQRALGAAGAACVRDRYNWLAVGRRLRAELARLVVQRELAPVPLSVHRA